MTINHSSRLSRLPAGENRYDMAMRHVLTYPELAHLAVATVAATNDMSDGAQPISSSYSLNLGKNGFFPELERTLLSLRCLEQLSSGEYEGYEEFTHLQGTDKLQWKDFEKLSERWDNVVDQYKQKSICIENVRRAAEVDIVLGDMGKTQWARQVVADLEIDDPDHDDFYGNVIAHPDAALRFGSFRALKTWQQELLRKSANLAHFGHIMHLEGGARMFRKIKDSNVLVDDPTAFEFATLIHICDVAGAQAHTNNMGSLTYNHTTHRMVEAVFDASRLVRAQSEKTACEHYIAQRSAWLGLSSNSLVDRTLTRVGAMLRLTGVEAGAALRRSFETLDPNAKRDILQFLSPEAAEQLPRTPTYVPAMLVNLYNNPHLGSTPDERMVGVFGLGVRFVAATFELLRTMMARGETDGRNPLNFNAVAAAATDRPSDLLLRLPYIDRTTCEVTFQPRSQLHR